MKRRKAVILFIALLVSSFAIIMIYKQLKTPSEKIYAGFRTIGGLATYWVYVAKQMASAIPGTSPGGIWILVGGLGFNAVTDNSLTVFDDNGIKVWLQVEPYSADIDQLINDILGDYGNHSCVLGFGIDLEWRRPSSNVTDEEAQRWVNEIKQYNPDFKLFLKHYTSKVMPPTVRQDIVFIDDSQGFGSGGLESMVNEFKLWSENFSQTNVGFQIGYKWDEEWWSQLENPPRDIGLALIENIPNCRYIYWTNETTSKVFPPSTQFSTESTVAVACIVHPMRKDTHAHGSNIKYVTYTTTE